MALRARSAARRASAPSVAGSSHTNSSPPNRATISSARATARSLAATSARTTSPVRWPWVSLTLLKWSISRTTALRLVPRLRASSTCSARCRSRARRLGKPLRASVVACCSRSVRASVLPMAISTSSANWASRSIIASVTPVRDFDVRLTAPHRLPPTRIGAAAADWKPPARICSAAGPPSAR